MSNYCKDCKHFVEPRRCRHSVTIDVVSGTTSSASCDDMRKVGGACGPEGRLWWGVGIHEPVLREEARHDHRI